MAGKSVGTLIKEARTKAGMTQAELAKKAGCTASDISKAERGEKELTQDQLKAIAKATGVTQKSLLDAAKGAGSSSSSSSKPASSSSSGSKSDDFKLTAAEKKLVELYRDADKATRSAALKVLKGEAEIEEEEDDSSGLGGILGNIASSAAASGVASNILSSLLGGKKEGK